MSETSVPWGERPPHRGARRSLLPLRSDQAGGSAAPLDRPRGTRILRDRRTDRVLPALQPLPPCWARGPRPVRLPAARAPRALRLPGPPCPPVGTNSARVTSEAARSLHLHVSVLARLSGGLPPGLCLWPGCSRGALLPYLAGLLALCSLSAAARPALPRTEVLRTLGRLIACVSLAAPIRCEFSRNPAWI